MEESREPNEVTMQQNQDKLPWLKSLGNKMVSFSNSSQKEELNNQEKQKDEKENSISQPEKIIGHPKRDKPPKINKQILPPQMMKVETFQPYKSTRPELLENINVIISLGLQKISRSNSLEKLAQDSKQEKIKKPTEETYKLYSQVFQNYIDESTLYQSFLTDTKQSYEDYILDLKEQLDARLDAINNVSQRETEHKIQIEELKKTYSLQFETMKESMKLLETQLASLELQKQSAEYEATKAKENMLVLRKEYEDLKNSCNTLTSGLSRMEAEQKNQIVNENHRVLEMTQLKITQQKQTEEIERLQQTIQNLEQIQSSMVSQDLVVNLEATNETLKAETRRMESTHRQLLLRYASLKSAVDECFKKWESLNSAGISEIQIRNQVRDLTIVRSDLNQVNLEPTEKIMIMMEKTGNPKLLIEILLDLIGKEQNRQRLPIGGKGKFFDLDKSKDGIITRNSQAFEGEGLGPVPEDYRSPWSHFDGLGYGDNIPTYLRFHGKIQNLYLTKRDIYRIINEIWEAKSAYDQYLVQKQNWETSMQATEGMKKDSRLTKPILTPKFNFSGISQTLIDTLPVNPTISIFFEYFLKDKMKTKIMAIEMAYNIIHALKQYSSLSLCRMFSAVLEEKLSFEIWYDQQEMVNKLREEVQREIKMINSSVDANNPPSNGLGGNESIKLTSDALLRVVKRLFPTKTEHSLSKLNKALSLDNQSSRYVNPKVILFEDRDGLNPHFLEQLKLQHINEALSFDKHLMDAIDQFSSHDVEMTISKLREAINYADPNKPRSEVNKFLSRACGGSIEDMLLLEAKRTPQSVAELKRKLRSGLLQKSPPSMKNK